MKLLSKTEADSSLKKENEQLIESNIRLRKFWNDINFKLNNARENYDPQKMAKLKDFEAFCKELMAKKEKLLIEYNTLQKAIEQKKEIYYGLITKQDQLDEKIYQMNEQEQKLKLREAFVVDLEVKWKNKNANLHLETE